eukprot:TRINITY_DN2686_c0_g1_i1.p1 TRINITY_DN2686_c0_g1~~TRINITY_DN2686_c0_g1_i1.p1  ORF type:complete len:253 (+),score=80.75 TRINITY_DN2686_c0_g1_i1:121-879(+)
MSYSQADPFYMVKEEVTESMSAIEEMFTKWKDLLDSTNTSTNDEFQWVSNEIKTAMKAIETDLEDLDETIYNVERDKARFKIDDAEIRNRKAFVSGTRKTIKSIQDEMNSTRSKGKIQSDARSSLMGSAAKKGDGRFSRLEQEIEKDNDEFIRNQTQRQEQIFKEQDEDLTEISHTVGTLKNMAGTIGVALDEHGRLIDDINVEADKADSGIKAGIRKVNQLIDSTKDSTQMGIIVILIIVLIGLVVLAIYI